MTKNTLLFTAVCLINTLTTYAQKIIPVAGFGNNGISLISQRAEQLDAASPAVQADGKILVPYTTASEFGYSGDPFVLRLNTDGTIDSSFGTNGMIQTAFSRGISDIKTVLVQQDQKIVTCTHLGQRDGDYDSVFIERWLPNGIHDATFAKNGVFAAGGLYISGNVKSMVLQPNGSITFLYYTLSQYYMAQLHADGTIDESFGVNGRVKLADLYYAVGFVALPGNGVVVAANNGSVVNLYAFNNQGLPLISVGDNGVIHISDTTAFYYANVDMKVYKNKLYVFTLGKTGDLLIRYTMNGLADENFGTHGKVYVSSTYGYEDRMLDVQADGKVVTALSYHDEYKRCLTNGAIDMSFDNDGSFTPRDSSLSTNFVISGTKAYIVSGYSNADGFTDLIVSAYAPENNNAAKKPIAATLKKITIYPNPATDVLIITGLNNKTISTLTVTDLSGHTWLAAQSKQQIISRLNVSLLKPGNYLLLVNEDDKKYNLQFIKK